MIGRFDVSMRKRSKRGRTPEEIIIDRFLTLYLLKHARIGIGDTKLHKLNYLAQFKMTQQGYRGFNYNFIKNNWGPWSTDLVKDIEELRRKKIITPYNHKVTSYGNQILQNFNQILERNQKVVSKIEQVNDNYARIERNKLVDYVHGMRNPDKPNLTIHETKTGWYILKKNLEGYEFDITEEEIASLEIYFEPENFRSLEESLKGARYEPAIKFCDL